MLAIRRLLVIPGLVLVHMAADLEPAHFAAAPGWRVREGRAHACVGVPAARCVQVTSVASTMRFRDCLECLPHRTVASMRPGNIAIKLVVAREHPVRSKRTFAWPPRITRREVVGQFEGLPARIGVYQGATLIGRREVSVFVAFGRAVPTNRQLRRANAELRRARFG